jgi:predicted ATPase/DNA-binding CsgD family transcriptional regulator
VLTPGRPNDVIVSGREAEILAAVGERLTNAEIATRLFISVRTVESHVSSLLRKLSVGDRRALAALAPSLPVRAPGSEPAPTVAVRTLPSPLTPFVGRAVERTALAAALEENRLVTAAGPGGVGKTRLALAVAADLAGRFADGVWYADLVPVTDARMVPRAIADVLGLGERQGTSATDDVVGWLAERETLLVLDNCEHLLDGVVIFVERLLTASPRSRVLATSRARLLVPFEHVFLVPGLSVDVDGGSGDAVELFGERAAAAGAPVPSAERARVAAVCRALDGVALAVELAAARYPSAGLDGIEAGLADRLRLLTGAPRVDDRHRSLRSTLDWSHALLEPADQAVLRRLVVFHDPFTAAAAQVVTHWPPVVAGNVPTILAGLADHSWLLASAGPDGTRYRALETIRQYGHERLVDQGELVEARSRHVGWCLDQAALLQRSGNEVGGRWRRSFDDVADELRGGLAWAAWSVPYRSEAYRLALGLAGLTFSRGLPREAQLRYEQAAELAPDARSTADALRGAAGAAESRHAGEDALSLRGRAAEEALRAGDRAGAASDLARNAERINRGPGLLSTEHPPAEVQALITRSRTLADSDQSAETWLLIAEAFVGDDADPATLELTERALALARRLGDPLAESAALDQLTANRLARGDVRAALGDALRRTRLMDALPVTATTGFEHFDAYVMASECAIAAGDLATARRLATFLRDLPFYTEEGHLATARLLLVTVLSGDWTEAEGLAQRFLEGWNRAGRPPTGNLSRGAYAAATMYGLRGDDEARRAWLTVVDGLETPGRPMAEIHASEFFDALLLLHRGRPEEAVARLATAPERFTQWYSGLWRPWYAALWAEAAVLAGSADADQRVQRARSVAVGNPIAIALVDRAAALATPGGDRDGLTAAAAALLEADCRYQWARTLVLLGGEDRVRGESALAAMGATPMAWPPG